MPAGAIAGGATLAGSALSSIAAGKAAKAQRGAAMESAAALKKAAELQMKQYKQTRKDVMPYMEAGKAGLERYRGALLAETPEQYAQISEQLRATPGYQFQVEEGQRALERGAAARGGLLSGATLKATQRYGQQLGSQRYGEYMGRLQQLGSQGLEAGLQTGRLGQQAASSYQSGMGQYGGALQQAGAARASGIMGRTQPFVQGISQMTGLAAQQGYMTPQWQRDAISGMYGGGA